MNNKKITTALELISRLSYPSSSYSKTIVIFLGMGVDKILEAGGLAHLLFFTSVVFLH